MQDHDFTDEQIRGLLASQALGTAIDDDAALIRARRECHALIDRTRSKSALEEIEKVIRALSDD